MYVISMFMFFDKTVLDKTVSVVFPVTDFFFKKI